MIFVVGQKLVMDVEFRAPYNCLTKWTRYLLLKFND